MEQKQLSWPDRGQLWFRLGIRLILITTALLLLRKFGGGILELTMPFLLGWAMAMILDPLISWLEKRLRGSRKVLALVLVVGLLSLVCGALFALLYYAGRELMDLIRNWDTLLGGITRSLDGVEDIFSHLIALIPPEVRNLVNSGVENLLVWLKEAAPDVLSRVGNTMTNKFMGVPSFVVSFLMFLMGTYFITADYPALCRRAARGMGEGLGRFVSQVRTTALVAFGGYLKAQVLLSCGVFAILLLGFLITGQEYGVLLAFSLALLDFIPLLGAGTVMVPWAVFALLTRNYPDAISLMIIWGIIAVFRRVAEPKIVGDQTGLSPILSLISIYVGMKLGGVPGMILGPILLLVVLNLVGTGMFHNIWRDIQMAGQDIRAILAGGGED